jgi:hypothetical protein
MKCALRKGGWYCKRTGKKCTNKATVCTAHYSPAEKALKIAKAEARQRHVTTKAENIAMRLLRLKHIRKQNQDEVQVGIK